MFISKTREEHGAYVSKNNERYLLIVVQHPTARSRVRLSEFDSLKDAADAWELTYDPLPEPEPQPEN